MLPRLRETCLAMVQRDREGMSVERSLVRSLTLYMYLCTHG